MIRLVLKSRVKNLQEDIYEFFVKNPNPKDEQVHAFAEARGIEPDDLETEIYGFISAMASDIKGRLAKLDKQGKKELAMGIKVEMEHISNKNKWAKLIATKIALDHIDEDKKYYTKLKKVEGDH